MSEVPPVNLPYLFAAFAVVWVVFFVYAAYMSWRRRSVQQELEDMQRSDRLDPTGSGSDDT